MKVADVLKVVGFGCTAVGAICTGASKVPELVNMTKALKEKKDEEIESTEENTTE